MTAPDIKFIDLYKSCTTPQERANLVHALKWYFAHNGDHESAGRVRQIEIRLLDFISTIPDCKSGRCPPAPGVSDFGRDFFDGV